MKKSNLITIGIIIGVIALSIVILNRGANSEGLVSAELAQCIGENSILYVQLGCSHCETQEKMFGENLKHLEVIDCFYERDKCIDTEIRATPTWIIDGEHHRGVQEIEELRTLTNC